MDGDGPGAHATAATVCIPAALDPSGARPQRGGGAGSQVGARRRGGRGSRAMTWSAATLEGKPLMQSTISQGRLRRVRHAPLSISPLCWRDPPPRVHREADVGAALAALAQGSEQVAAEEPAAGAGAGAATPDRRGRP